jgi:hypothetical protein
MTHKFKVGDRVMTSINDAHMVTGTIDKTLKNGLYDYDIDWDISSVYPFSMESDLYFVEQADHTRHLWQGMD